MSLEHAFLCVCSEHGAYARMAHCALYLHTETHRSTLLAPCGLSRAPSVLASSVSPGGRFRAVGTYVLRLALDLSTKFGSACNGTASSCAQRTCGCDRGP